MLEKNLATFQSCPNQFVADFSLFLLKESDPLTSQILLYRIIIKEEMIICSASSHYLLIISNRDLQQQNMIIVSV